MSENEQGRQVEALADARKKAYDHLFELSYSNDPSPITFDNWEEPDDKNERLKTYIDSEIDLAHAKVQAAFPGYNIEAQAKEMQFRNASDFMETKTVGIRNFEEVVDNLYKERRQIEMDFAFSPRQETPEVNKTLALMAAQKHMVQHIAEELIGPHKKLEYTTNEKKFKDIVV